MARYGFGGDQWFDGNRPLSGGKLWFYETGVAAAKTTYSDVAMTIENTNPVVLDADGRQGDIFFTGAAKVVIKSAANVVIDEVDPVYPVQITPSVVVSDNAGISVDSYASLLAIEGDENLSTCNMLGFTTPADGGGGLFYWSAASTATVNIGTIVKPTDTVGAGRWIRVYQGGPVDIRWFGAVGDGTTDNLTAITAASVFASEQEAALYIPAGVFAISDYIPMLDNMRIVGDGAKVSILRKTALAANDRIFNKEDADEQYNGFSMFAVGLMGSREDSPAEVSGGLVSARTVDNIEISNCRFSEGRGFALNFNVVNNARVMDNHFENVYRDCIGIWNASRVQIIGNTILRNDDDGISLSVSDFTVQDPSSTNWIVSNNSFTDSGGVRTQGGRVVNISDNTFVRVKSSKAAIYISALKIVENDIQNPHHVMITGNMIADFIDNAARTEGAGSSNNRKGIKLEGYPYIVGSLDAAPGEMDNVAGTMSAPFTYNYTLSGALNDQPIPRMHAITVYGNTVSRTLPSGSVYSDWGYGEMFTRLSGTGWVDPVMTEAYLNTIPLTLEGPIRNLRVESNYFSGTGLYGILIEPYQESYTPLDLDIDEVYIKNNTIRDCSTSAIEFSVDYDGLYFNFIAEGNIIDCDPRIVSSGRELSASIPTGGWASQNVLVAVNYKQTRGCRFINNTFKNCSIPFVSSGTGVAEFENNVIEAQPTTPLFDVTNLGVGYVDQSGRVNQVVYKDSDPTSSTYGKMLEYAVRYVNSGSPPTEGYYIRGDFIPVMLSVVAVRNGVDQMILGYKRMVTGNAHVLGTDWKAAYVEV